MSPGFSTGIWICLVAVICLVLYNFFTVKLSELYDTKSSDPIQQHAMNGMSPEEIQNMFQNKMDQGPQPEDISLELPPGLLDVLREDVITDKLLTVTLEKKNYQKLRQEYINSQVSLYSNLGSLQEDNTLFSKAKAVLGGIVNGTQHIANVIDDVIPELASDNEDDNDNVIDTEQSDISTPVDPATIPLVTPLVQHEILPRQQKQEHPSAQESINQVLQSIQPIQQIQPKPVVVDNSIKQSEV